MVRENKHLLPKVNKSLRKKMALFGRKLKKNKEYLKKIGKLKEEATKRW